MSESESIRALAQAYASADYIVFTEFDYDGDKLYVIARNMELEGCMADGETDAEARENERVARVDYIETLLKCGLPIPTAQYSRGQIFVAYSPEEYLSPFVGVSREWDTQQPIRFTTLSSYTGEPVLIPA